MQRSHKIRLVISYLLLLAAYIVYLGQKLILYSLLLTILGLVILLLGLIINKPKLNVLSPAFVWRKRKGPKTSKNKDPKHKVKEIKSEEEEEEVEIIAPKQSHQKTSKDINEDIQEITKVWAELEEEK
ncbi:hypothetical protein COT97_00990 [Candidatus Falkowbacteria bacterium CG10_big_fil_rev_8_21_14_0_10_39_11]|uniref:Uncharacterized protein n=1 Tax=Candidatus Falkowbacteria bacterium CG10_big_fil_rev_8_21_14_0_10_39_11 TaxID=1974565 RepID=A0A2H0V608_9BACT|nr:MAG: hypothetical protein COT97_00990 [Candidatus Falkowbacteria bacterium CG10_big_fil_rev_8_21_14_0_10_39_11]